VSDRRLHELIAAVADGEPIDWRSAHRQIRQSGTVHALEAVAALLTAAAPPAPAEPVHLTHTRTLRVLGAAAAVKIGLGVVGLCVALGGAPDWKMSARLGIALCCAGAAWFLLRVGTDRRAGWLGGFYLLTSAAFAHPGVAHLGRLADGSTLLAFVTRSLAVEAFLPWVLWKFARDFPATDRFCAADRLAQTAARVAFALGALLACANVALWAWPAALAGTWVSALDRSNPEALGFWIAVLSLSAPALIVMGIRTRRAPEPERRRFSLFVSAFLLGTLPLIVEVLLEALSPPFARAMHTKSTERVVGALVLVPLLALPFATAWSILTRRALDVRIVFRRGLRYLLAKRSLTAISVLPLVVLVAYIARHRGETITSLLSNPTATSLILLGLAGTILLVAQPWLSARLDAWFDVGKEDVSATLATVAETLRHARTAGELEASLCSAVEDALTARAAVLLVREEEERALVPIHGGVAPIAGDSALALLLRERVSVPVAPHERGSMYGLLPPRDKSWVDAAGAAVVVPISGGTEMGLRGAIVCGPRRDGASLMTEDIRLLDAMASAAGLGLDGLEWRHRQPVGASTDDELARECEGCGRVQGKGAASACACGGLVRPAAIPVQISGKYRIDQMLGRGGMGIVYRATDLVLGRPVAVKTLRRLDIVERTRLAAEARAMASLAHPHLATIYGMEIWRSTPLLIVEYFPAGTLADRLSAQPMAPGDALNLGTVLSQALEYMHQSGVLHRDLKPANVGLTADGTPKLLDFGLAALVCADARRRGYEPPAGTAAYMSPEAIAGGTPDAAYDIWGLNVLLHVALTARLPFRSRRSRGLCLAPLPHSLRSYFERAFDADKDRRWQSAADVRRELTRLQASARA
jgi:hypothetical protein